MTKIFQLQSIFRMHPRFLWTCILLLCAEVTPGQEITQWIDENCADCLEKMETLTGARILEQGEEGALQYEIKRQIKAGKVNGNRFIMSLGSPVTPGTSVDRVKRYLEWSHELGMS